MEDFLPVSSAGLSLFLAKADCHELDEISIKLQRGSSIKLPHGDSMKMMAPLIRLELMTHWLTAS